MAKTLVGALRVTLGLDSAEFAQGAARVQAMSQKMAQKLALIGGAVSLVGAGMAEAIRRQINAADDMGEIAQKLGVPVEALSALQHAAKITGVSFESLQRGLLRLSKGMKDAPQKFAALGVSVRDANGEMRPTAEVLKDIAERFQSMPDGAEKTALAMELFGKSGAELIPMLNAGKDGITALMDEAAALGLVISQDTADAAGRFNENLDKLKATAEGLAAIVAAHLAPVLEQMSGWLLEVAAAFQNLSPETQKFMAWAAGLTIVLGPVLVGLGLVAGAISSLSIPFIAATAAVAGLVAAWVNYAPSMEEYRRFWENIGIIVDHVGKAIVEFYSQKIAGLMQSFNDFRTSATEVWEGIKTTIGGAIDYVVQKWDAFVAKLQAAIQVAKDVGQAISDALSTGKAEMNDGTGYGGMGGAMDESAMFSGSSGSSSAKGAAVSAGFAAGIRSGWPDVIAAINEGGSSAAAAIRDFWQINSPSRVTEGMGLNVAEGLAQGMNAGAALVGEAAKSLTDTAAGAMEGIGDLGKQVGDMFATAATNVLTGVTSLREAVGQLLQQLAQLLINSAMKSLFGNIFQGLGLGSLTGYATGTASAAAGLAMVGEEGPELINFKGGERVYNARDTSRMLSGGGSDGAGGPVQVTVNTYLNDELIHSAMQTVPGEAIIHNTIRRGGY
jgi:phage-related protein